MTEDEANDEEIVHVIVDGFCIPFSDVLLLVVQVCFALFLVGLVLALPFYWLITNYT